MKGGPRDLVALEKNRKGSLVGWAGGRALVAFAFFFFFSVRLADDPSRGCWDILFFFFLQIRKERGKGGHLALRPEGRIRNGKALSHI
jgi:hypothetical protein